jgi:hypothetical protein
MKKMKKICFVVFLLINHLAIAQKQKPDDVPLINPENNCLMRYYYFPNLEAYFDTQKRIYYYKENGDWTTGEEIPNGYRGYSLYNKIYVYITDYDDDNICQFVAKHKKKFPYTKRGNMRELTASTE